MKDKMNNLPSTLRESLSTDFLKLWDFFYELDCKLNYPQSEGNSDKKRYLLKAQQELILRGKV